MPPKNRRTCRGGPQEKYNKTEGIGRVRGALFGEEIGLEDEIGVRENPGKWANPTGPPT